MIKTSRWSKAAAHALHRMPINSSTEIRLTRLCSQRCRQCQVYERQTEPASLSLASFKEIGAKLCSYGAHIGFISGGEATLVPDLIPILEESRRIFPTATNLVTGLINQTEHLREIARFCLEQNINIQTSLDGLGAIGDNLRGVDHFAERVLDHMAMISAMRGSSRSLLYANIVLNRLNLDQVPELITKAKKIGWKSTIGLYHHLTETTREDDELALIDEPRLVRLLEFLDGNPDILNLNSFILGIRPFLLGERTTPCPFVAAPALMTRLTIMENADVHLCWGGPIGNLFTQTLEEIFRGQAYRDLLQRYRDCAGCWTTCYTQRYLLIHPHSAGELFGNLKKIIKIKKAP